MHSTYSLFVELTRAGRVSAGSGRRSEEDAVQPDPSRRCAGRPARPASWCLEIEDGAGGSERTVAGRHACGCKARRGRARSEQHLKRWSRRLSAAHGLGLQSAATCNELWWRRRLATARAVCCCRQSGGGE